jgi:hypothetical protein
MVISEPRATRCLFEACAPAATLLPIILSPL